MLITEKRDKPYIRQATTLAQTDDVRVQIAWASHCFPWQSCAFVGQGDWLAIHHPATHPLPPWSWPMLKVRFHQVISATACSACKDPFS